MLTCNSNREERNKVFENIVEKGKIFMGWLFWFKQYIIINYVSQIIIIKIIKDNV